jgi:dUTPase
MPDTNVKAETLCVAMLTPDAQMPLKPRLVGAGISIATPRRIVLLPHTREAVHTLLVVAIPAGYVMDHNGMAAGTGVHVLGGVIDPSSRTELVITLYNTSYEPVEFAAGTPIAQLLVHPAVMLNIIETPLHVMSSMVQNETSITAAPTKV